MKAEEIEAKAKQIACTGCTYERCVYAKCSRIEKLVSMATWVRDEMAERASEQALRMCLLYNLNRLSYGDRKNIKAEVKRVMMEE